MTSKHEATNKAKEAKKKDVVITVEAKKNLLPPKIHKTTQV